ncbi:MAG: hypothetical protein DUD32_05975 [Lactobacillus sp.]|nr:MAG: hypothetical protein DUD32_05975 [Lactobacillus sp.]
MKVNRNLPADSIGFLKFTDFFVKKNKKIHPFEDLMNGNVYIDNVEKLNDNELTASQRAIEGSVTDTIFNLLSGFEVCGNNTVYLPKSLNYCFDGGKEKVVSRTCGGNYSILKSPELTSSHLKKFVDEHFALNNSSDVKFVPKSYVTKARKTRKYFYIKTADILIGSDIPWGTTSFTVVRQSDLVDGKLNERFLHDLTSRNTQFGDAIGYGRPWIYIAKNTMLNSLKNIPYPFLNGIINYYEKDHYPLSYEDILLNLSDMFFLKPARYREQREWRVLFGGPKERCNYVPMGETVNFKWSHELLISGKNTRELAEHEFN